MCSLGSTLVEIESLNALNTSLFLEWYKRRIIIQDSNLVIKLYNIRAIYYERRKVWNGYIVILRVT